MPGGGKAVLHGVAEAEDSVARLLRVHARVTDYAEYLDLVKPARATERRAHAA